MSNLNEYELNDAESLFFKADQTINDGDIPKAQKMLLELADKYPSFVKLTTILVGYTLNIIGTLKGRRKL